MPRKLRPGRMAAGAAITLVLAGAGFAAGAGRDPAAKGGKGKGGRIVACYQKQGGAMRFLPRGAKCLPGEKQVKWRKKGRRGKKGGEGDAGPEGLPGEQGIRGLQGETGAQGLQGATGNQGSQGIPGDEGPEGPAGNVDAFASTGDDPIVMTDMTWETLLVTPTGTGTPRLLVFTTVTPTVTCNSGGTCSVTFGLYLDGQKITNAGAIVTAAVSTSTTRSIFLVGIVTAAAGVAHPVSIQSANGSNVSSRNVAEPQQITVIQLD